MKLLVLLLLATGCDAVSYDLRLALDIQIGPSLAPMLTPASRLAIDQGAADSAASLGGRIATGGQLVTMVYETGCQQESGAYVSTLDNTIVHWCLDFTAVADFVLVLYTMHEMGHVLGAHHVPDCGNSIMYAVPGDSHCNFDAVQTAAYHPADLRYSTADLAEICAHTSCPGRGGGASPPPGSGLLLQVRGRG